MIEAYAVGVGLTLDSNIAQSVGGAIEQFKLLRNGIRDTQGALNELASGMRALKNVGTSAATEWKGAADAMRSAAAAAVAAGRAMNAAKTGPAQAAPGTGFTMPGYTPPSPRATRQSFPMLPYSGGGAGGGGVMTPFGPGNGNVGPGGIPINLSGGGAGFPPDLPPNPPPAPPGFPPRPGAHDFAIAGIGYGIVGGALTAFTGNVVDAGMETGQALYRLRASGFTDDQVKDALALAKKMQQDIPGVTVGGGIEAQRDLALVMRNPDNGLPNAPEISKNLPEFLRMATVLQGVGKGGDLAGLLDTVRQGELKGMINSPADLQKLLFLNEYITMRSGGLLGPSEVLQYMRSGGAAAQGLSLDEQFSTGAPLILSMGAARAGTGLRGFYQQFNAGKESDAAVNTLIDMGLIKDPNDPSKLVTQHITKKFNPLEDYKTGIGQYRLPASILPEWEMLNQGREFEWIEKVLQPAIEKYNKAFYGFNNVNLESSTGVSLASRIPGGNMLADMFRLWPMIQSYRASYGEALKSGTNSEEFDKRVQEDPTLKMKAFQSSWNAFLVSMASGPFMDTVTKMLGNLTGGLNALGKAADDHPKTAALLMDVAASLGVFGLAVGTLAGVMWMAGPMMRVGRWAVGGAAAAEAGAAAGGVGAAIVAAVRIGIRRAFWPLAVGTALWDHDPFDGATPGDLLKHINPFGGASAAPAAAPTTTNLTGTVNLDGKKVGDFVATDAARNISLPPTGPTGPDPRMNLRMPGMSAVPDFGP